MRTIVPILALSMALAGCSRGSGETMVRLPPPRGWEADLRAFRGAKDEHYKLSPDSPLVEQDVESFVALDYFEPTDDLYFVGPLRVHAQPEKFEMVTTTGSTRPCERFAYIEFPVDGKLQRLNVYRMLDGGGGLDLSTLFLPFADATTGTETYPAGRYLNLQGPDGPIHIVNGPHGPIAPGPFVVDFNLAYNPSCAYGAPERFACPKTPPENKLDVPIHAGELGYKAGAAEG